MKKEYIIHCCIGFFYYSVHLYKLCVDCIPGCYLAICGLHIGAPVHQCGPPSTRFPPSPTSALTQSIPRWIIANITFQRKEATALIAVWRAQKYTEVPLKRTTSDENLSENGKKSTYWLNFDTSIFSTPSQLLRKRESQLFWTTPYRCIQPKLIKLIKLPLTSELVLVLKKRLLSLSDPTKVSPHTSTWLFIAKDIASISSSLSRS